MNGNGQPEATINELPEEKWEVVAGRCVIDERRRLLVVGKARAAFDEQGRKIELYEGDGGLSPTEADRLIYRVAAVPDMEREIFRLRQALQEVDAALEFAREHNTRATGYKTVPEIQEIISRALDPDPHGDRVGTEDVLYFVVYKHRHGQDVVPYIGKLGYEPEPLEVIGDAWEGEGTPANREDEECELIGPILLADIRKASVAVGTTYIIHNPNQSTDNTEK